MAAANSPSLMLYSLENVTQEGNLAEVKTNFCFKPPLSYTFISLLFPNFMSLQFQFSAGSTSVQGQVVSHPPKVLELQQGLARDTKGAACWASFPSLPFSLCHSQPWLLSCLPPLPKDLGPCLHLEQEKCSRRRREGKINIED